MYGAIWRTMGTCDFWLCSGLCCVLGLLPAFWQMAAHKIFVPSVTQRLAEHEASIIQNVRTVPPGWGDRITGKDVFFCVPQV